MTWPKMDVPILALPRPAKRTIAQLVDLTRGVLTVWVASYLRLGEQEYLAVFHR
jgi:hypothetical protein